MGGEEREGPGALLACELGVMLFLSFRKEVC